MSQVQNEFNIPNYGASRSSMAYVKHSQNLYIILELDNYFEFQVKSNHLLLTRAGATDGHFIR